MFIIEDILDEIKSKALELNRYLTKKEVLTFMFDYQYKKYFGNQENLKSLLNNNFSKEELKQILLIKTKQLGRTPYKKDIKFPQRIVFIDNFGSWRNAMDEVGFVKNKRKIKEKRGNGRQKFDRDKVIEILVKQYQRTNLVPTYETIEGVSRSTIQKNFGSLKTALIEAKIVSAEDIKLKRTGNGKYVHQNNVTSILSEPEQLELALKKLGLSSLTIFNKIKEKEMYKDDKCLIDDLIILWEKLLYQIYGLNNVDKSGYIHIKDLLKNNHVTQIQFAREIGLTEAVVEKWCANKRFIQEHVLDYIEKRFNVNKNIILPQKNLQVICNIKPRKR